MQHALTQAFALHEQPFFKGRSFANIKSFEQITPIALDSFAQFVNTGLRSCKSGGLQIRLNVFDIEPIWRATIECNRFTGDTQMRANHLAQIGQDMPKIHARIDFGKLAPQETSERGSRVRPTSKRKVAQ
jgi:hypothetical protein